ncbi:2-polyprenyl-6-methoxyphenol hydroxylase-like FAD-dependent oxidoreductase [Nocardia tenerifensis]|uniref:2-polyprenyl-6-methoxyphenol hydroxylase-like FAD-dependent oxidoreductase n=1 Tax=Nocardia tenerifensis TaxID=228006 RepID=A0A318KC17_9NOCA|nr:FAD-dependent monooxygenase [Nocardia tenerifensis]PXX55554.1 2-polyprenyl-6-methoxyphenol hydroxylase-like FAD-dependent oxidoreductase [Nocardia tenerifensis]
MTSTRGTRVLIAGGGIGGLAAALALQRSGFHPVVFERSESLRDGGAGLHIWTNGTLVLDHLGVADEVLKIAPRQDICRFGSHRGELYGAWDVGGFTEKYGRPTIAVERSVLHGVLGAALDGDVVRTGARVVGFTQDEAGVTVRLADGGSITGDLLIGADGIHSAVRAQLLGDTPPRYNGYIAWRGKARMHHELIPPGTFHALFGPGTRFTYYDVAPGVVHWMSVANGPPGGRDNGSAATLLAQRHQDWVAPVGDILAATPESAIIRSDVIDRPPDRRWGTGRVTLLGDAAHPITFNIGQGACQALEDAAILAETLAEAADLPRALRTYEAQRRRRTAAMQRTAWLIGRMGAVEHPLLIRLRAAAMRRAWRRMAFRAAERDQISYATRWSPSPATK